MKTTKQKQVLTHLFEHGKINTWEAIQLYGATRLSHIIYMLRGEGFVINSEPRSKKDRNGNNCNFCDYVLINDETLLT